MISENNIQMYLDEQKTMKAYPRTKADNVIMTDGKKVEDKIVELNEQLEQNKSELTNKINEVATTGTTTEIVENTTRTVIDEKIADGTIANMTIPDGSIEVNKINFIKTKYNNLLIRDNAIKDYYVNYLTGELLSSTSYYLSDYIEVKGDTLLYISNMNGSYTLYDSSKTFIRGGELSQSLKITDAEYIRFNINKGYFYSFSVYKINNLAKGVRLIEGALNAQGNIVTNASYHTTDFIEVKSSSLYIFDNPYGYKAEYDSSKQLIKVTTTAVSTLTTNEKTKYIRVSTNKLNDLFIFYENFDKIEVGENIDSLNVIENIFINQTNVIKPISNENEIKVDDLVETIRTENLFNKENVKYGYYNITDGSFVGGSVYNSTDFIECLENEVFTINHSGGYTTFWDSEKNFISGINIGSTEKKITIPTDANIKFFITTLKASDIDSFMLVKGESIPLGYRPYEIKKISSEFKTSLLSGKLWNVLGDSITAGGANMYPYHSIISDSDAILVNNYGIYSTTIAKRTGRDDHMCERYINMSDDADIITVLGGVNDCTLGVPLGDINSSDITTFYGACNVLFKGLIEKYPTKGIGIMTPIRKRNSALLENYVNAIKDVAKKYSLPVLDLYNMSGLNPDIDLINDTLFNAKDGLHPNTEGYKIITPKIREFIKSLIL